MILLDRKDSKNQGITQDSRLNEQGNALLWILICVALFAGLSYAVSQNTRGGSTHIMEQKADLAASEILDYGRSIKGVVQQLQINGCDDVEISFEQTFASGYANPNAPTDESCHVFQSNGGNLNYQAPSEDWLDKDFNSTLLTNGRYGKLYFHGGYPVENIGSAEPELTLLINFVEKNLCMTINETLNIQNLSTDAPGDTVDAPTENSEFDGVFGNTITNKIGDDVNGYLTGKTAGCWKNTDNDVYQFYQVLIAR